MTANVLGGKETFLVGGEGMDLMTILFVCLYVDRYLLPSDVLNIGIHFLVFKFAATLKPAPREEENTVKIRN